MVESIGRPVGYVQSLDRGLAVICCFSADRPRLTLSEVARQAGLSRAAARRSLITLQTLGYVASDGRQFSLTPAGLDAWVRLPFITVPSRCRTSSSQRPRQ